MKDDVVERLKDALVDDPNYGPGLRMSLSHKDVAEAAAEILALRERESRLQAALLFWMPGVDMRLDEPTRELAAKDAGLLAGNSDPLNGPCWGDAILERALAAEARADAMQERCAKVAENAWRVRRNGTCYSNMLELIWAAEARSIASSAVRASPSTRRHSDET